MNTKFSWHSDMSSKASKQVKAQKQRLTRLDQKRLNDKILASDYPPLDVYLNAMRQRFGR